MHPREALARDADSLARRGGITRAPARHHLNEGVDLPNLDTVMMLQFQYRDHFVSPTEFEWQSQNRATQTNTYGQRVKNHRDRGEAVHLFVRRHRKLNGGSAPFVYCGEVEFKSWTGEKPITVRWTLKEPVPERMWGELKVPGPAAQ